MTVHPRNLQDLHSIRSDSSRLAQPELNRSSMGLENDLRNVLPRFGNLPTVGIIGGGQLARMTAQAAKRIGLTVAVLDPTPYSPAAQIADHHVLGDFHDETAIRRLVSMSDVTTFDLENVNTDEAKELWEKGHRIHPAPSVLKTIQDKLAQKEVLAAAGIPVPRFEHMPAVDREQLAAFGYPLVQKSRVGGYDGRGVRILRSESDAPQALQIDSMIEQHVAIAMELAVVVARGEDGALRTYPVVEMEFDPAANLLDLLIAPARIPDHIAEQARQMAINSVAAIRGVGIFAVEMFLTRDGLLLVNEIAPRPHNSGHFSIEACHTDQFEQHLRAVLGLPLGSTALKCPAVMVNLVGPGNYRGEYRVTGLREAMAIEGVSVHLYGKRETRPNRKMGHITACADDLNSAIERARLAKTFVKIEGEKS